MSDKRINRWIASHFVWTIAVAAVFFKIGGAPFQLVLLVNAGSAVAVATMRREGLGLPRLTLWDEAVGLIGVSTAAGMLE
jgi:hypothetical protein